MQDIPRHQILCTKDIVERQTRRGKQGGANKAGRLQSSRQGSSSSSSKHKHEKQEKQERVFVQEWVFKEKSGKSVLE